MDAEFDALLDEYQEREAEEALERAGRGDIEAVRPDAVREVVTFADLRVGDYMTAEDGPLARWVRVVKCDDSEYDPEATVTFQTPQPLGVAMEDHWVIRRPWNDPVTVDAAARGKGS